MPKAKKHSFVISDESVNDYGFMVRTGGIDLSFYEKNPVVLYAHNDDSEGEDKVLPIGKGTVYVKGTQLIGDVEFDQDDDFAIKIEKKVAGGFLNATSIRFLPLVISNSNNDASASTGGGPIKNEIGVVEKCILREFSIVALGSNLNAVRLCSADGKSIDFSTAIKLSSNNQKNNNKSLMKEHLLLLASIAGITLKSTDEAAMQLELSTGLQKMAADYNNLKNQLAALNSKKVNDLVEAGIKSGKIPLAAKAAFVKLGTESMESLEAFVGATNEAGGGNDAASAAGAAAENANPEQASIAAALRNNNGSSAAAENADASKDSEYMKLSKSNPAALELMAINEPAKYAKVVADHKLHFNKNRSQKWG